MKETRIEVIGTTRDPDGVADGRIKDLVFNLPGDPKTVSKNVATEWAQKGLLWCRGPNGQEVEIEPRHFDSDGQPDYVATKPDRTVTNNLLRLHIWHIAERVWRDWHGTIDRDVTFGNPVISDWDLTRIVVESTQRR